MCVAVLVETKEGPTAEELWHMEDSNPHGAGLAWASGDLIRYRKGLTWKQARDLLARIPRPALLHFRWATHGGRARYLSHPFPIGPRAIKSRKMNSAAPAVLIHNGVWKDYDRFAPLGLDLSKWSDTAVAAYAAGAFGEEILDHVDWSTAVGRAAGDGRMDVTLRGSWEEHNGNMYSNLYWIPRHKYVACSYSPYVDHDDRSWGYSYEEWLASKAVNDLAIEDCGTAVEDIPSLTANPREPRWRADGKLVSLPAAEIEELPPEQPIDAWLRQEQEARQSVFDEYAAVQRALRGEE